MPGAPPLHWEHSASKTFAPFGQKPKCRAWKNTKSKAQPLPGS